MKIKSIFKLILSIINFFILIIYIPFFSLKFLNSKKKIFLIPFAGFGHTISAPCVLEFYHNDDWILIFGFYKKRHNKLIADLFFKKKLFFFNYDLISLFNIQMNHYDFFEKYLFYFIDFFFKKIFKKKTFYFLNYVKHFPINPVSANNPNYKKITDYTADRVYWRVNDIKFPQYELPKFYIDRYNKILSNIGGNFRMRVGFVLRNKDKLSPCYNPRDTMNINFYEKTILYMVKNNFQVIFGGDEIEFPSWIYDFKSSVITRKKIGLSKEDYNIFSGMSVDTSIGPHSGSRLFDILKIRKNLILEHSFIGDAFPNSFLSYKKFNFKTINQFQDLIYSIDYYDQAINQVAAKKNISVENLNSKETLEIVVDFLENFNNQDYGVKPQTLGIHEGILVDSNSRLSPVWLKLVGLI